MEKKEEEKKKAKEEKEFYKSLPKIRKDIRKMMKKKNFTEDLDTISSYFLTGPPGQDNDGYVTAYWNLLLSGYKLYETLMKYSLKSFNGWLSYPKEEIRATALKVLALFMDEAFVHNTLFYDAWKMIIPLIIGTLPNPIKLFIIKNLYDNVCKLHSPHKCIIESLKLPERVDIPTKNMIYKKMRFICASLEEPNPSPESLISIFDEHFSQQIVISYLLSKMDHYKEALDSLFSLLHCGSKQHKIEFIEQIYTPLSEHLYTVKDNNSNQIIEFLYKSIKEVPEKADFIKQSLDIKRIWETHGDYAYLTTLSLIWNPEDVTTLEGIFAEDIIQYASKNNMMVFCYFLRSPAVFEYVKNSKINYTKILMKYMKNSIEKGILQAILDKVIILCNNNPIISTDLAEKGVTKIKYLQKLMYNNDIAKYVVDLLCAMVKSPVALKIMIEENTADQLSFIDKMDQILWEPVKSKVIKLKGLIAIYNDDQIEKKENDNSEEIKTDVIVKSVSKMNHLNGPEASNTEIKIFLNDIQPIDNKQLDNQTKRIDFQETAEKDFLENILSEHRTNINFGEKGDSNIDLGDSKKADTLALLIKSKSVDSITNEINNLCSARGELKIQTMENGKEIKFEKGFASSPTITKYPDSPKLPSKSLSANRTKKLHTKSKSKGAKDLDFEIFKGIRDSFVNLPKASTNPGLDHHEGRIAKKRRTKQRKSHKPGSSAPTKSF